MKTLYGLVAAGAVLLGAAGAAWAQDVTLPHPGQAIYRANCATCHDNPDATKAPSKASLQAMSFQTISYAITTGKMQAQGANLDDQQREQLLGYLTGSNKRSLETWSKAMRCEAATIDLKGPATVTTYGFDARNTRNLTAAQAGLTKAQLGKLDLAWAIAFPDVTMIRAQGAVVGKMLFLPVAEAAAMYAFDLSNPAKPCVKWVYNTPTGTALRSSPSYGVLADGRQVLAFSGIDATVYVVDAKTGQALWTKNLGAYSYSMGTATPRVLKDRIIFAISEFEILQAADNRVKCCTNHGFIVSLNPKDGAQQWRYDTMPEAKPIRDRGDGKMLWGPSGAPIWNSPVVDEKRGLIYFGTGESNSPPSHPNTDALIAIGLADGKQRWSFQAMSDDIYNSGCGLNPAAGKLNCVKAPETVYRDSDFGASLILAPLKNGKDILLAGQKSSSVWGLDPDTGRVIFRRDIGSGAVNGGIHWGIAYKDDTLYVPVSVVGGQLPGGPAIDPGLKPGLYALDANNGLIKWSYGVSSDCGNGRDKRTTRCDRNFGLSGAATIIDGAVVVGSLDGHLYVIDGQDGHLIWKRDTLGDYTGVNGVAGKGGAIDGASILGVNGLVLTGSGYSMFGQTGGNVLLAFRPKS